MENINIGYICVYVCMCFYICLIFGFKFILMFGIIMYGLYVIYLFNFNICEIYMVYFVVYLIRLKIKFKYFF